VRRSGALLHLTSLPSAFGIGDLGPSAYDFAEFLAKTGQGLWQVLSLGPTDPAYGNSPYHSVSAFAQNPLFISPELLLREDLLEETDLEPVPQFPKGHVDYDMVTAHRRRLLQVAYEYFRNLKERHEYDRFCSENSFWLDDFALFVSIKDRFAGQTWSEWPGKIRDREPQALSSIREELRDRIEMQKFLQYLCFGQWLSLKRHCNQRGIQVMGDIPIYVDYDSADVWTNPQIFKLDEAKKPYVVAGVPPDYFSQSGQLWGNPLYRWDLLSERGYDWWVRRMDHSLRLFDLLRIDHFRGFVAYWEVPVGEETAAHGKWVSAPAYDFFRVLARRFPCLPIVAEDLGVITPDVREVMRHFRVPGMKVLLFAFGEDSPMHPYLPHTYEKNCVAYTGTHDNNTVRGWFENEATPRDRERLFRYLGGKVPSEGLHWELIRLAMMSIAERVILPVQDILGLGEEARMNRPGTPRGNWEWRLAPEELSTAVSERLKEATEISGRA